MKKITIILVTIFSVIGGALIDISLVSSSARALSINGSEYVIDGGTAPAV